MASLKPIYRLKSFGTTIEVIRILSWPLAYPFYLRTLRLHFRVSGQKFGANLSRLPICSSRLFCSSPSGHLVLSQGLLFLWPVVISSYQGRRLLWRRPRRDLIWRRSYTFSFVHLLDASRVPQNRGSTLLGDCLVLWGFVRTTYGASFLPLHVQLNRSCPSSP